MSEHVKEVSDSSFENDVLSSDQPVLVDFWAAWCAPCRMLAPTVEAVAEKYAGNARGVKLNVDDNLSVGFVIWNFKSRILESGIWNFKSEIPFSILISNY